jgi:hypothetical protein
MAAAGNFINRFLSISNPFLILCGYTPAPWPCRVALTARTPLGRPARSSFTRTPRHSGLDRRATVTSLCPGAFICYTPQRGRAWSCRWVDAPPRRLVNTATLCNTLQRYRIISHVRRASAAPFLVRSHFGCGHFYLTGAKVRPMVFTFSPSAGPGRACPSRAACAPYARHGRPFISARTAAVPHPATRQAQSVTHS